MSQEAADLVEAEEGHFGLIGPHLADIGKGVGALPEVEVLEFRKYGLQVNVFVVNRGGFDLLEATGPVLGPVLSGKGIGTGVVEGGSEVTE